MAQMEHECRSCGHVWFDNVVYPVCPKCGKQNALTWNTEREKPAYEREEDDEIPDDGDELN